MSKSRERKRQKSAPVALAVASQEMTPAPELGLIAQPGQQERFGYSASFGGYGPEEVYQLLRLAESGQQERIQDFYSWMLETDPHLLSTYETRIVGLSTIRYNITPAKSEPGSLDEERAQLAADFISKCIDGIDAFDAFLHDASDGIGRGFSVHEIEYKRINKTWRVNKLHWLHPRRMCFGEDWSLRLYDKGEHGPYGKCFKPNKFVVHMPKQRADYPTRTGVLRAVVWTWMFKRWMTKYGLSAAEKFGVPTPYGHVSESTPQNVVDALRRGLESLAQGQAAIFRGETAVNFLTGSSSDAKIYSDHLAYFNAEMSKAVLGSTLNVEGGANGNRAAAESQASTTIDPRIAFDSSALACTIRRDIVRPLLGFNLHLFGDEMPPVPTFEFVLEKESEKEILPHHIDAGAVTINEIRRTLKLDPLPGEAGEAIAKSAPSGGGFSPFSAQPPAGGRAAELPLASDDTKQATSSPTPQTLSRFAETPIGRVLSRQLGDRQS